MSQPHDELNADFESALRKIRPAAARVDPIAAAFEAGRRSRGRTIRVWQSVAGGLALVAVVSWGLPTSHPAPKGFQPSPSAQEALFPTPSPQSMYRLEQVIQQDGIDALPPVTPAPARPLRLHNL